MTLDNPPRTIVIRPLDDPPMSHCAWCGVLHWLSELEMITTPPAGGQLRCRPGLGCREAGEPEPAELVELEPEPAPRGELTGSMFLDLFRKIRGGVS